jgi:hypothetical protein
MLIGEILLTGETTNLIRNINSGSSSISFKLSAFKNTNPYSQEIQKVQLAYLFQIEVYNQNGVLLNIDNLQIPVMIKIRKTKNIQFSREKVFGRYWDNGWKSGGVEDHRLLMTDNYFFVFADHLAPFSVFYLPYES